MVGVAEAVVGVRESVGKASGESVQGKGMMREDEDVARRTIGFARTGEVKKQATAAAAAAAAAAVVVAAVVVAAGGVAVVGRRW